jgi:hypothetical protein
MSIPVLTPVELQLLVLLLLLLLKLGRLFAGRVRRPTSRYLNAWCECGCATILNT